MAGKDERVNILLVDDQPAKLLSYEVILGELNENMLKASSATEALQILLKNDIAVLLVDVCMPDLDGFQFASMVRGHPRFEKTAIIFISAILLSEGDSLKGYELGAVDYVPVPVVPELLRAKVRVFVDLYRKTAMLERLNAELEDRVRQRTKELEDATRHQELLAREVDHRAKNALAVVTSIVKLTKATNVDGFAKAVNGRIRAMANAHTLLSESRWAGADLMRLIHDELAPFQGRDRVVLRGSSVVLRPAVAQSVAMAIHELATNAAKYGALSTEGGQIVLSWRVVNDGVELEWKESGGPATTAPTSTGFGMKVIEASVMSQSRGEISFDWQPDGLCCRLRIPEAHEKRADTLRVEQKPVEGPIAAALKTLTGARVMLAEDEPLIAMMIADVLDEHGATVVGPFASVDRALSCEEPFDVALLDVNLDGENIYPLAAKLKAAGRPFVFATGYDDATVDSRFSDAVVLQKPLEPGSLTAALGRALLR